MRGGGGVDAVHHLGGRRGDRRRVGAAAHAAALGAELFRERGVRRAVVEPDGRRAGGLEVRLELLPQPASVVLGGFHARFHPAVAHRLLF